MNRIFFSNEDILYYISETLTREIRILVMISHGPSRDSNIQFRLVGRQIVLVEPRRIFG